MLLWVLWADFLTTLNVHNFSNKTLSLIPDFWSQPMSTSTFSLNLAAGPKTWMIGRSLSNVGAILSEQNNKKVSRAVFKGSHNNSGQCNNAVCSGFTWPLVDQWKDGWLHIATELYYTGALLAPGYCIRGEHIAHIAHSTLILHQCTAQNPSAQLHPLQCTVVQHTQCTVLQDSVHLHQVCKCTQCHVVYTVQCTVYSTHRTLVL